MLRVICGVVLVHFALAAPMESAIQRRRLRVCGPGEGDLSVGCTKWKGLEFCTQNRLKKFMASNCAVSCGICTAAPTPAPIAVAVAVTPSACLGAHNAKRGHHQDTPNLSWDSSLAQGSEKYAVQLANTDPLSRSHSSGDYGENIYEYGTSSGTVKTCSDAVTSWYSEIQYYNWNKPGSSNTAGKNIGHFSQVVWKSSIAVGCGAAKIKRGYMTETVVICRYTPGGNADKQYGDNVKPRVLPVDI